ncbi:OmpH family outer membrane protein [Bernardetia sp.]|uniref:OmpH family outer membrane protein n=1 Tax=Bernardetia sp. TaxID=1937974 RepID=UPI0025C45348|nr:OmpH family outer membrane protein [Bernardetia sp.]
MKSRFNKTFYLVLSLIVSFVAFTGCQPQQSKNANASTTTSNASSSSNGDIAYINIDTLTVYYDFYIDVKERTERTQKEASRQLQQQEIALQSKAESFQKRASQGLLSENAAKKEQQDLQTEYQMLERQKASKSEALILQNEKDMDEIFANIEEVLEEYKAEKGYKVVLGTQKGAATILYADKNLDITKPVLDLLNAKYKAEKDSAETAN